MNAMAFVSASTLSAQRTASSNVLTQWVASVEGRLEPITMETLPGRCPGRDSNVARPIIRLAPRVSGRSVSGRSARAQGSSPATRSHRLKIGRASARERGGQGVEDTGGAGTTKKQKTRTKR